MSDEQKSLSDALEEAFDAQVKGDEPEKDEPEKVEPEGDEAEKDEPEGDEPEKDEPEKDESENDEGDEEVEPPEHWSDEDKKAFVAMDESGREWALRLEKNAHKGIEEKSKELKKFRDAIQPYRSLIPAGVDESQVIQQLLNAQAVLNRNPVEGIKWLMKSYGVDEKQFAPTDTPDNEYVDPEIRKLQNEIAELKRGEKESAQTAEHRRQQAMYAEITQFRDEIGENGEPLHPHFNDVQGVMAGLLTSGRASNMQEAYDQSIWSIPEYRDSVVEQKAREQAEKTLAERTRKSDKAKAAGKSVQGKSGARKTTEPRTIGDALTENYEKSIRGEL